MKSIIVPLWRVFVDYFPFPFCARCNLGTVTWRKEFASRQPFKYKIQIQKSRLDIYKFASKKPHFTQSLVRGIWGLTKYSLVEPVKILGRWCRAGPNRLKIIQGRADLQSSVAIGEIFFRKNREIFPIADVWSKNSFFFQNFELEF